jgi:hypothetical protein
MKILKDSTYQRLVEAESELKLRQNKPIEIDGKTGIVVAGPTSRKDEPLDGIPLLKRSLKVYKADFEFEVIPVIRKLAKINPDVNQALDDFVKLANTGHNIKFDPDLKPEQVEKMKEFLNNSAKEWSVGAAGKNGVVNKMFRQAMIGGAISNEWVPNMDLNDIEEVRFIKPENIRYVVTRKNRKPVPYQKIKNQFELSPSLKSLKKLNTFQYKYLALNGDTDSPYGCPPYLPVLKPAATQQKMIDNIDFIVQSLGLLGHLEAKIDKPDQNASENDGAYETRLRNLLLGMKDVVMSSLRDGVTVGFKDDHEFDFKQTTPSAEGAQGLFEMNELQMSSALKYDAAFMGRPGSTETLITILFTKMLAQLSNIQSIIGENLEFGYKLALTLGGFKFKTVKVEFKRSTITDDLKLQQAEEIKLRNLVVKYQQGIISQEQFADEAGYEKPDQIEPREDPAIAQQAQVDKENREADKDKSDKKVRDKNNPQGTVKKQKS